MYKCNSDRKEEEGSSGESDCSKKAVAIKIKGNNLPSLKN